jgi:hypothetical protein
MHMINRLYNEIVRSLSHDETDPADMAATSSFDLLS